jgi:hypothetical protein
LICTARPGRGRPDQRNQLLHVGIETRTPQREAHPFWRQAQASHASCKAPETDTAIDWMRAVTSGSWL